MTALLSQTVMIVEGYNIERRMHAVLHPTEIFDLQARYFSGWPYQRIT
jgi:hypothetical protein